MPSLRYSAANSATLYSGLSLLPNTTRMTLPTTMKKVASMQRGGTFSFKTSITKTRLLMNCTEPKPVSKDCEANPAQLSQAMDTNGDCSNILDAVHSNVHTPSNKSCNVADDKHGHACLPLPKPPASLWCLLRLSQASAAPLHIIACLTACSLAKGDCTLALPDSTLPYWPFLSCFK